ncbi:MAG TPA: hypothetical protein VD905_08780 [Flavobacteriales bacterium]|nr:hypothetical protein [Flavobacteriales bacterium]
MPGSELLKFNPTPLQHIARFCFVSSAVFTLIGIVLMFQTHVLWSYIGNNQSYLVLLFVALFFLIFLLFAIGKWLIPWRINRYYKGRLVLSNEKILFVDPQENSEEIRGLTWYKLSIKQLVYLDAVTKSGKRVRFNFKLGTGYTTKITIPYLAHECAHRNIDFVVKSYLDTSRLKLKRGK